MNLSDALPQRGSTHDTAEAAEHALSNAIQAAKLFLVQSRDRFDYGTDMQLEARSGSDVTNIRVHVQVKGTEKSPNSDGSVSISIDRANLNYLANQPDSLYVCYHLSSERLLVRRADDVLVEQDHRNPQRRTQATLTVRFIEPFDDAFQSRLHARVLSSNKSVRAWRFAWSSCAPGETAALIRALPPQIEVPFDPKQAKRMLVEMSEASMDPQISSSFARFEAVLGNIPGGMDEAYMAEVNLGLNGYAIDSARVQRSISIFEEVIARGRHYLGTLRYCQANAYLALGDCEAASSAYIRASELLMEHGFSDIDAQCRKNLGSALEKLGRHSEAKAEYENALRLDPELGEALFALALWHCRHGDDLALALDYLDQVIYRSDSAIRYSAVHGWRVHLLFRLGDAEAAFRDVNALLSHATTEAWIWPWCARQVAEFGTADVRTLRKSIKFWHAYLREMNQGVAQATYYLQMCHWRLRSHGETTSITFEDFKESMLTLAKQDGADVAFLWDRIGHWAEYEKNWEEAERAYRIACDLNRPAYGFCLGAILNCLERFEEAAPLLEEQAFLHQPDAISWTELAKSYEGLRGTQECIAALLMAIELDGEHAIAWFELGRIYWNSGQIESAVQHLDQAIRRFPDHPLTAEVRQLLA